MRVETRETIVIHGALPRSYAYCAQCRTRRLMVSLEEARQLAGVSARTIFRWVESGRLHYVESPAGDLKICVESLRL